MFPSLSKEHHLEIKLADYTFRDEYRVDNTTSEHIPRVSLSSLTMCSDTSTAVMN